MDTFKAPNSKTVFHYNDDFSGFVHVGSDDPGLPYTAPTVAVPMEDLIEFFHHFQDQVLEIAEETRVKPTLQDLPRRVPAPIRFEPSASVRMRENAAGAQWLRENNIHRDHASDPPASAVELPETMDPQNVNAGWVSRERQDKGCTHPETEPCFGAKVYAPSIAAWNRSVQNGVPIDSNIVLGED